MPFTGMKCIFKLLWPTSLFLNKIIITVIFVWVWTVILFMKDQGKNCVIRRTLTHNKQAGTRGLEIFFKINGKNSCIKVEYRTSAFKRGWCTTHKAKWRFLMLLHFGLQLYSKAYIHGQLTQYWNLLSASLHIVLPLHK